MIIYYTDIHDVDEDMRTIVRLGGYWAHENWAGATYRHIVDDSTEVWDFVASKNNHTLSLPRKSV